MIKHPGVSKEDRIYLYKIAVARSDITSALFTTRLFMKTVSGMKDEGFMALQDSIVVSYARPFTRNKPYGPLDTKWSKFENLDMKRLHNQLIEHRNKLSAHSDKEFRNVEIIPRGMSNIKGIPTNSEIAIQISTKLFSLNTFPMIERLCLYIGSMLNQEVNDMLDKLYGKMPLPKHPFALL